MAIEAEQLTAAKAESHAAGVAEGMKSGAAVERTRIKAIVEHPEAEGRTDLASHLAFETDMSADAAVALLGKSAKVAAQAADPNAAKTALQIAMEKNGTPGLNADDATPPAQKSAWASTVQKFGGK